MTHPATDLGFLTQRQVLAGLLGSLRTRYGGYRIVEHWKQGEFHHDLVSDPDFPADFPAALVRRFPN